MKISSKKPQEIERGLDDWLVKTTKYRKNSLQQHKAHECTAHVAFMTL